MPIDENKYEREIEEGLGTRTAKAGSNYSQEYQQFLSEQLSSSKTFYIRACQLANNILHIPISKKDYDKVNNYIQLLHLQVTPQATFSIAYLSAILIIIPSLVFIIPCLRF